MLKQKENLDLNLKNIILENYLPPKAKRNMESSFLSDIFLPLALFIIMLGIGLSLKAADFQRILLYPKAVTLGLINQLILLPLIGFGLAIAFELPSELAVGLMILAVCPGGVTSNLISHLSKGDTALSISLTAVCSIVTIFSIPFLLSFSMNYFMAQDQLIELNVPQMLLQLIAVTLIPVSLGIFIGGKKPAFAERMEKPVKIFSGTFFALIVLALIVKENAIIVGAFKQVGLSTLALNISTMLLGFVIAALFNLNRAQRITISIESGIQNGTLAIVIATSILQNSQMAIPPAVYSLIMFMSGGLMIFFFGRRAKSKHHYEEIQPNQIRKEKVH
jgi:bile acid:Na+ symporter, BASS family